MPPWGAPDRMSGSAGANQDEGATMKIRPLQDRIVVKRVESETQTKGGIIIPDTAKEKPIEGRVVAVGNGKVLRDGKVKPLEVKVGDKVLFGKYTGTEVKIDGEEHVLIREDDVLAVTESASAAT
jgi:chaperonin GroES